MRRTQELLATGDLSLGWKDWWPRTKRRFSQFPGAGSWLALLLLIVSWRAWVASDNIIEWLLKQKIIEEAATLTLPGTIAHLALGGMAIGFVCAWRAWLWVARGLVATSLVVAWGSYHWAPTRPFIIYLDKALTSALTRSRMGLSAAFLTLRAYLADMLRFLLNGLSTILRYVWRLIWLPASTALRFLWLGLSTVFSYSWTGVTFLLRYFWLRICPVLRYLGMAIFAILRYLWLGISSFFRYVWAGVATIFRLLWLGTSTVVRYFWLGVSTVLGYVWVGIVTVLRYVWLGVSTVLRYVWVGIVTVLRYVWLGVSTVLRYVWVGIVTVLRYVWLGVSTVLRYVWVGIVTVLRYVWLGVSTVLHYVGMAIATVFHYLWLGVATVVRYAWWGVSTTLHFVWVGIVTVLRYVWLGASSVFGFLWLGVSTLLYVLKSILVSMGRLVWTGLGAAPDASKMALWMLVHRKGVSAMSQFDLTRQRLLSLIGTVWVLGILAFVVGAVLWPAAPEPTVQVVHWSNGHLIRTGSGLRLLEQMAIEFNQAGHQTQSGERIEVKVSYYGSWEQARDLLSRVTRGVPVERGIPNPTIVTPSASHWLVNVNGVAGRTVVDISAAQSIALAYTGIVTYRDMAECLGWPEKEIGYADIIALRDDPRGWASYPCAKAEWGQRPIVAYTDPTTSDTGRGVLIQLYAMAAGKAPEQLTLADVNSPEVVGYVREFQSLVDHYLIATRVLNSKVYQGPRYGHFFLMPEDNLIHLYEGTEAYFDPVTGEKGMAPPIERPMVMIYPKEGSIPRDNLACIVQASWVTAEQAEAAQEWVAFLREDEQQRDFMKAGFRPATSLPLTDPISPKYGLDPTKPTVVVSPERIDPAVAGAIDESWEQVKRPGIVTFVLDTSGSMTGAKLQQAKDGLILALDAMAKNNRVGFVSFADTVKVGIPVAPLAENRFGIADAVRELQARGETALYDAIKAGVEMTDRAAGDQGAIRAVVVLTDGRANRGQTGLDELIQMTSRNEIPIRQFDGFDDGGLPVEEGGKTVAKKEVIGKELAIETIHPVQIFFIGIGDDADMQVGRLLAEATAAEFQGATEKDLATVLEEFSKYF